MEKCFGQKFYESVTSVPYVICICLAEDEPFLSKSVKYKLNLMQNSGYISAI
jgi:hypothetical protein